MYNTSGEYPMVFPTVRPKAICIIRKEQQILVEYSKWPTEKDVFYVPLGGQIKYGEYGEDTIRREILEEIKAEVEDIHYLGTIENIFEAKKKIGHEIVLVYEARFVDETLYEKEMIEGLETEPDPPLPMVLYWKTPEEIEQEGLPLYPEGLRELLEDKDP
jgi:ADP-ribose pyrophosphatase YjhB (NUDIX family)